MSVTAFSFTGAGTLAQPTATGPIVVRSDNASDTNNVTVAGTVSASPDSDTIALAGQVAQETTKSFSVVSLAAVAGALTGTVSIRQGGTAGIGYVTVEAIPADGDTLVLGLQGFVKTYTFRLPASFTLTTVAASGLSQGDFFDIAIGATTYRFWFAIDGSGTGAPSDVGVTLTKVDILSTDTDAQVATALEAAMESAITGWSCSVSSAIVTAVKDVLGNVTLTFTDGSGAETGFAYGEISEGTADAANQIRTGYDSDGTAATVSDVAGWIDGAIDLGGTAGTTFGTGTTAHGELSPSLSGTVITLTDKVACLRGTPAWACVKTGSWGQVINPVGGADGTLLASFTGTDPQAFEDFDLDDEGLTGDYLPALFEGNSDAVTVGGKKFSIWLMAENVSSAISAKYQLSNDGSHWYDGASSITDLDNNTQAVSPDETAEYLRLVVTANANTANSSVNAKVSYP